MLTEVNSIALRMRVRAVQMEKTREKARLFIWVLAAVSCVELSSEAASGSDWLITNITTQV